MSVVHYVFEDRAIVDIGEHVFPTTKYRLLADRIREELGVVDTHWHPWEPVEEEDLARVHTPRYLEDLREARATWATVASELPVDARVIAGFRAMTGGSIAAVRLALSHGIGYHVGGGFHHAFPDHAEGFCYFHDVAIAVERLRADEGLGPVLIVDVDVHQGNGTAVIYQGDRETFTYSIHQQRNYPVKQRSDLDRGLEDGTGDAAYLEGLRADLDAIDQCFAPDLVCYVAGVDPHRDDQLGGLGLSREGIAARDREVLGRYRSRGVPVAVFLAGGYSSSPRATADLHLYSARAAEECTVR